MTAAFERFVPALGTLLTARGASSVFVGAEADEMSEWRVTKTTNRSVVGVMNEFAFLAGAYTAERTELDLLELSLRLGETPCGPLYKHHVSPDRELAALLPERDTLVRRWSTSAATVRSAVHLVDDSSDVGSSTATDGAPRSPPDFDQEAAQDGTSGLAQLE